MTRGRLISAGVALALILGVIVDVIAVTQFGFEQGNPFRRNSPTEGSSGSSQFVTASTSPPPTATPVVTPTPTPVPPLGRQLKEALSVSSSSSRGTALFVTTQDAIIRRDYWTVIRAASATPSSSAQARSLAFVVRCAIEDELFDFAAEAASKVRSGSTRDRLKIEVLEARKAVSVELTPALSDRASRQFMACFD